MTVSDSIAQSRSDYFTRELVTRIDVRPEAESGKDGDFFGGDGLTFGDVLDAVNPLNHIPIVSDLFAGMTGHTPSAASRLVGGTLLGGPIGFVAGLASVIFEGETGASPAQAVYAALTSDAPAPTQLAAASDTQAVELASLSPEAAPATVAPPFEAQNFSSAVLSTKDKTLLDLYGTSTSAHDSYKKAQLLPYLREVSHSQVL